MKRKVAILGLCALAVLVAVVVFSGNKGRTGGAPTAQSLVVTQDGKLTCLPRQDLWRLIADAPEPGTSATSTTTNPKNP
jgi:hypothetical protein